MTSPWKQLGRCPSLEQRLKRLCASQAEFVRRCAAAANVAEHGELTYRGALQRTIALLEAKRGADGKPRALR